MEEGRNNLSNDSNYKTPLAFLDQSGLHLRIIDGTDA